MQKMLSSSSLDGTSLHCFAENSTASITNSKYKYFLKISDISHIEDNNVPGRKFDY